MASRLLARLDAAIARSRDPVQVACLRAERAGFLARHGQVGLARTQLQELQRQFSREPHAAVSGWLALAEGQVEHYTHLGGQSHDRFNRAYALSRAAQLRPLQALAAAWLGHSEYVRNRRDAMARLSAEALTLAEPQHHGARWRAALTVASAYHLAGCNEQAEAWYIAARTHAMADGDDAAISALLWNQAALRFLQARWAEVFGGEPPPSLVASTDASTGFDRVMGVQSLDWLGPMLRAQLATMEGRWGEGLALIDEHFPRSGDDWRDRMAPSVLADRAWCLWHLGRHAEAGEDLRQAGEAVQQQLQGRQSFEVDDRALAQARMAEVAQALGEGAAAAQWRAGAERDAQQHHDEQQRLRALLDAALQGLNPR